MITEEQIRKAIGEVAPDLEAASLAADEDFIDAGMDSLDVADLLLALQESSGLEVPDDDLELCRSIQGILAYAARGGS